MAVEEREVGKRQVPRGSWVGGWAQRGLKSMGVLGVNQMIRGSSREIIFSVDD